MQRNTIAIPILLAFLAAGCSSGGAEKPAGAAPGSLDAARARMNDIRSIQNEEPGGGTGLLEEIRVPVAESWLDLPLTARYTQLPAATAFRLIAQGRPVRFDFDLVDVPPVIWPPDATTIREHLDSVAEQADWTYRVEGSVLRVTDIEKRNFSLSSQPGTVTAGLGLRNLNASGGSTADNSMELELDPYATEILDNVRNMLGLAGGGEGIVDPRTAATISPSANLLVVTAKPSGIRDVERFLELYNTAVRTMIRVELSLIEVDFSDEEQRELALNVIRRGGDGLISLLLGSAPEQGAQGAESGGTVFGAVANPDNRYNLSSAVFDWLDSFGDSTITFDDTFEVLSNHVASVDLTRTEQYVSKITREPIEGSNQLSTEVEIDNLRTGQVLHLQPTVDGDRIVLRLGLSRSALVGRTPYTSSSAEGETLTTDDFNRTFSVALVDGRPKLLSSLSQSEARNRQSRIPFFGKFNLGTSRNGESRKKEVVMLITASLIDEA